MTTNSILGKYLVKVSDTKQQTQETSFGISTTTNVTELIFSSVIK